MSAIPFVGHEAPADRAAEMAPFWGGRWSYPQALTVATGLIGTGMILQAMHPSVAVELPGMPWNWLIVFGPLVAMAAARRLAQNNALLLGLGGIPMAIVSVLSVVVLCIPAAIWPQGPEAPAFARALGFDHLFSSLGFVAALALMLTNLAIATGKRSWPLTVDNVRFLLLHGGLLLAIGAACAGSSGLQRARIMLVEAGSPSTTAMLDDQWIQLPFAARLDDFRMTQFPPTLSIATRKAGSDDWSLQSGSSLLSKGAVESLGGYRIAVHEFIPRAVVAAGTPQSIANEGASPAALVGVSDATGAEVGRGWLHARGEFGEELFLMLPDGRVLVINPPRPKSFESVVQVVDSRGEARTVTIGVNEPVTVDGWTLYQLDYDDKAGAASRVSVLEAVHDTAYPAVAAGCWVTILGLMWFLWGAAAATRRVTESEVTA